MNTFKKIILIFLSVIFISVLLGSFCLAQRKLEIVYPPVPVPGVETPTTTKTALPEYLKYLFTFAITIAGILAFGALIYGGFFYLTSAGDPSKMKEGQDQIVAGFLGLIILLSSYLILNTINPQLVILEKPAIEKGREGVRIYTKADCQDDEKNPSFSVRLSIDDLTSSKLDWGFNGKQIKSIEFLGAPGSLDVTLWADKEFKGTETPVGYPAGDKKPCKQGGSDFPLSTYKSISLDWHIPGVYLYANEDCAGDKYGKDYVTFQASSATLPEFNDKTKSIKFLYDDKDATTGDFQIKFAAILHEDENFMGKAVVAEPAENGDCINLNALVKLNDPSNDKGVDLSNKVSSITVYLKPVGEPIGQGVRFWGDKNYTMEKDQFILPDQAPLTEEKYYGKDYPGWNKGYYVSNVEDEKEGSDNKISSIKIKGYYLSLLFEHPDYDGNCEVFMSSDPDFRTNRIGQCGFLGRTDCLSSFIIKARK